MAEKTYWLTLVDTSGRTQNTVVRADSLASAEESALKYAREMNGWCPLQSVSVSPNLASVGRELWDEKAPA